MGVFDKHVGKEKDLEIGGDHFKIKPLTVDYLPEFLGAMRAFSGATKKDATTEDILNSMNPEGLESLARVISKTLEISYPEEPKEKRDSFGLKYMGHLIGAIFELNSPPIDSEARKELISE